MVLTAAVADGLDRVIVGADVASPDEGKREAGGDGVGTVGVGAAGAAQPTTQRATNIASFRLLRIEEQDTTIP